MMSVGAQIILIMGILKTVSAVPQQGNITSSPPGNHGTVHDHKQRMVCYWASWAVYRPTCGKFDIDDIDATLCNHLIYTFLGMDETTYKLKLLDEKHATKELFERLVGLKKQNPDLQVSIAIGGWTEGSIKYSAMAANTTFRKTFIDSIVTFIKKHKFDGLDFDWQYPADRGGAPEDKENFVSLMKELRQEFDKHNWLLTAAMSAIKSKIEKSYNVTELARYLDYFHIINYDYHGKWDGKTGHNAPLYPDDGESDSEKTLNVEYSIDTYLQLGCPPEKLVMGLPLYGHTFLLQNPSNPQIGSPSHNTAFSGSYTTVDGLLGYNEVCEKQKSGKWKIIRQKPDSSPYMIMGEKWVSYDDAKSLHVKTAFARKKGLAGVMTWTIDTDDFRGICFNETFPLLRAINRALAGKEYQHVQPSNKTGANDHCQELTGDAGSFSTTNIVIVILAVIVICFVSFIIYKKCRSGGADIEPLTGVTMQSVQQPEDQDPSKSNSHP